MAGQEGNLIVEVAVALVQDWHVEFCEVAFEYIALALGGVTSSQGLKVLIPRPALLGALGGL